MEEGPQVLPPPILEPISRADSASTSTSLPQLPGIQALAAANAATPSPVAALAAATAPSPQQRSATAPQPTVQYTGASPAATSGGSGGNLPTCQNCSTSTTPLWRRDEFGSVLCNACGLFLKLHGRPRPISLKTDVIKSRNRVKTLRPDLAPKKKQQQQQAQSFPLAADPNGVDITNQAATAAHAAHTARRTSQKSANGQEGSDSPISRTGTPSMYNHGLPSFMVDDPYQPGVGGFASADGRAGSPLNGDRAMDAPQTHEQLIAHNSSLKTRVSELEVINELFRGRLSQLEQQEAAARRGQEVAGVEQSQLRSQLEGAKEVEAQLRAHLDDSHRRENSLKRRLDDLELELKDARDAAEAAAEAAMERPAKKQRLTEPVLKQEEVVEATAAVMDIDPPAATAATATTAATTATEASETAQTEAPKPEALEVPEAPEAPEVPEAAKVTEVLEPVASTETADGAEATEAVESAEAPKVTEAPAP